MPAHRTLAAHASTLLVLLCALATSAHAAWTTNTMLDVPICQAANDQGFASPNQQNMVADGSGGFYVVWQDQRFISGFGAQGTDIYGQHFNYLGNPLWGADGALLAGGTTNQFESSIVTDGAGGVILSWSDARTSPTHIYAQRFNAAGAAQWTAGGVAICVAAGGQSSPMMVADGSGGAYIVWNDQRNSATTGQDIYMQRVNGSGVVQWTADGTLLSNGPSAQYISSIAADPTGGFWAVWQDYRNSATTSIDLYMNRVYPNAFMPVQPPSAAWSMCSAAGAQNDARVISDGLGGAYFTWSDARGAVTQVYGQRYSINATAMWATDGAPLVSNLTAQFYAPNPRPILDGAGGLILLYGTPVIGERAIHLLPTGARLWGGAEINLYTTLSGYSDNAVLPDGHGGFEVIWSDYGQAVRVRAQRYDANGTPQWAAAGSPVCTAISGTQSGVMAVSDGAQGFFTAWADSRNGGGVADLFGGHVDRGGRFGGGEPSIASVRDIPNDQGGKLRLNFNASYLDQLGNNRIYYYNIYRQVPGALAQAAGPGSAAYRATRYGAQTYFWEAVATIYPKGFEGYSAVIATTGDSTGLGNPRTLYMVEATDVQSSFIVYDSQPDSGYSVDNLPPAAPAPLPSQYSPGLAKLHWSRNLEADLAGYRVYRSTSPVFTPNATNFVAAVADTGFADATSQPYYYELTAVDAHGNESAISSLTPQGVLGVGDGAGAATLALARPAPSPASSHTRIACTLPRAMRLELTLHDTAGRLVQRIAAEDAAAGTHAYDVSLRDGTGRALAPGIYLVRLAAGADVRTQRLVVLGD